MKVNKTLSLPVDVAKRLDEEDNQSAVMNEALRNYYGMDQ